MKWEKTNLHAWTSSEGFMISRHWTLTGVKVYYFLTYENKESYYSGNNIGSYTTLTHAKNSFK